jgi:signal transduction histidine kinase
LWAGYIDGRIAMWDGEVGSIFTAAHSASLGPVEAFLESTFGLFVGASNGIAVLRGDHLQALLFTDPVGVRGISGLLQASNGDLWANGLHGIFRIPASEVTQALATPTYQMRTELFAEAGIIGPSPQVLRIPTAVKDANGVLWFSTSGTVVSVDPNSIHPSTTPPILSGLSTTVDGVKLPVNRQIHPGYHTIRIKYLGAYITAPEKVTYKYKLDRADTTWQEVGARTEAVYTGLRPGHYRFSVMASNGEGAWSQPDNSMEFTVLPSFYQRPTFLVLCVAAAIGIIWSIVRLRIRYIAGAVQQRAEIRADERVRIARDLHDTLLQGVQALTLRFHVVSQNLPEKSREREAMEAALTSADRIVMEARNRVSHLRVGYIHGKDLCEAFQKIAEELDYEKQVRFTCGFEELMGEAKSAVLQELYYIGREAVINALRHSHASEVAVTLQQLPKELILTVRDNGCGFDPDGQLNSSGVGHWGFRGMKERADTIGARFECVSLSGKGTRVLVRIPSARAYNSRH